MSVQTPENSKQNNFTITTICIYTCAFGAKNRAASAPGGKRQPCVAQPSSNNAAPFSTLVHYPLFYIYIFLPNATRTLPMLAFISHALNAQFQTQLARGDTILAARRYHRLVGSVSSKCLHPCYATFQRVTPSRCARILALSFNESFLHVSSVICL